MNVVVGIVEHGDARGRTLGFPTANIPLSDGTVEDGVWAALVSGGSTGWAPAAVSVGRRRTFYAQEGQRLLEAHILDFNEDIYGRTMRVELITKLRAQQSFPTIEALTEQLQRDVRATREWVAKHYPWWMENQKSNSAPARELV